MDVRPTTDRVREALFSALSARILDAVVLDLFAGTGALGLEALSRGASAAVFVEQAPATARLLQRNVAACGAAKASRIMCRDALVALRQLAKQDISFDIVFLDPPYQGPMLQRALALLPRGSILSKGALVVAEHPKDRPPPLPSELHVVTTKHYGTTVLSFIEDIATGLS